MAQLDYTRQASRIPAWHRALLIASPLFGFPWMVVWWQLYDALGRKIYASLLFPVAFGPSVLGLALWVAAILSARGKPSSPRDWAVRGAGMALCSVGLLYTLRSFIAD